jgi:hypothetical protein
VTWFKEDEDKLIERNERSIWAQLFGPSSEYRGYGPRPDFRSDGVRHLAFQMALTTLHMREANTALGELGLGARDERRRFKPLLVAAALVIKEADLDLSTNFCEIPRGSIEQLKAALAVVRNTE